MTEIPGIIVPTEMTTDLDEMVDEVGVHEPLMTFPSAVDEEDGDWPGALDAMIASGLFGT